MKDKYIIAGIVMLINLCMFISILPMIEMATWGEANPNGLEYINEQPVLLLAIGLSFLLILIGILKKDKPIK